MSLFAFPHVTLHGTLPVVDRLARRSSGCSLELGCLGSNPHSAIYPGNLGRFNALSEYASVKWRYQWLLRGEDGVRGVVRAAAHQLLNERLKFRWNSTAGDRSF
jgi:hypothetical protein